MKMIDNKQTRNADDLLVNDLNGSESFMGKAVYLTVIETTQNRKHTDNRQSIKGWAYN